MPKISIITVCYNAEIYIAKTIESVLSQTYSNYEYIIVDGGSSDKTLSILENYKSKIDKLISEPDNGLYYAMNKGIKLAQSEYIIFINAGDTFHASTTLENLFSSCRNSDVIYGDTLITDENWKVKRKRRLRPPAKLKYTDFNKGMLVSHQAFVAKRSLAPYFDTNYRYSADFNWCVEILKRAETICNASIPIAHFMAGGQTSKTILPGLKERFSIMLRHYGFWSTLYSHFYIVGRFFIKH